VTSIGSSAFKGCTSLTSIKIPNSVTIIYGDAFASCNNLVRIYFPKSVELIGGYSSSGGYVFSSEYPAFTSTKKNVLIFEDGIKITKSSIWEYGKVAYVDTLYYGDGAADFYNDLMRPKILIVGGVYHVHTNIKEDSLQAIYSRITEPEAISKFESSTYLNVPLYVPTGTKSLYESLYGWKQFFQIIEMDMSNVTPENLWAGYKLTSSTTSIDDVLENTNVELKAYYSIDGKKLSAPQKGINIVKMSDGTSKKIFVQE